LDADGDYWSSAYIVEVSKVSISLIGYSFDRSNNFDEIKCDEGGDVILSLDIGDLEYESDEPDCLQD